MLLLGLLIILIGAGFFTNAVEWLGCRLGLSEGAVGSIFAAVGTALPESIIPIVAILFSNDSDTAHIGIGAILGAPFMLGTLALFITGISARCFTWRGPGIHTLNVDRRVIVRDLSFFVLMYSLALAVSFSKQEVVHNITAIILVVAYIYYVTKTIKSGKKISNEGLRPLYCCFWKKPGLFVILLQTFVALGLIIWGATHFVEGVKVLANLMAIPSLVLALIIAPIATELPEKFNSVIWIAQKKDTLALGNITGAMVFQSSIIPAFGILFTPWQLNSVAMLSGILVLTSIIILTGHLLLRKSLYTSMLIFSGFFYLIFLAFVIWGGSK
ncbi:MAG: sodium:calcium antiporter [Peptococcales bacterium]|jgi:cation:H+ antiporter